MAAVVAVQGDGSLAPLWTMVGVALQDADGHPLENVGHCIPTALDDRSVRVEMRTDTRLRVTLLMVQEMLPPHRSFRLRASRDIFAVMLVDFNGEMKVLWTSTSGGGEYELDAVFVVGRNRAVQSYDQQMRLVQNNNQVVPQF